MSRNISAAKAVAMQEHIKKRGDPGRKEMLEMLGLIESANAGPLVRTDIARDPENPKNETPVVMGVDNRATTGNGWVPERNAPVRDRSLLPEGLRNFPQGAA